MKMVSSEKLKEILKLHKMWLNNEEGGERADLRGANLRRADLRRADLSEADLSEADLSEADLCFANLRDSNLRHADLSGSNLRSTDLRGADLDFSCWPLWCGSLMVKVCRRFAIQLAYHWCRLIVDDDEVKEYQKMLWPLANQFHRADECGRLGE